MIIYISISIILLLGYALVRIILFIKQGGLKNRKKNPAGKGVDRVYIYILKKLKIDYSKNKTLKELLKSEKHSDLLNYYYSYRYSGKKKDFKAVKKFISKIIKNLKNKQY